MEVATGAGDPKTQHGLTTVDVLNVISEAHFIMKNSTKKRLMHFLTRGIY